MIKISGLEKSFGEERALKNISFDIKTGETISIIGPSGSGKSTLLRCINYLEEPDKGTIAFGQEEYNFKNITDQEIRQLRSKSSMVFQNYDLFKNKTALENITEHLIYVKKFNKAESEDIGYKLLDMVGLKGKEQNYPHQLSGGQKQRVGIARAMAMDTEIMLFDEPTSSLDPELINSILHIIEDLSKQNQTMLIVTHEMEFAKKISDRIIFLEKGSIIQMDTPEKIFENSSVERVRIFLNSLDYE